MHAVIVSFIIALTRKLGTQHWGKSPKRDRRYPKIKLCPTGIRHTIVLNYPRSVTHMDAPEWTVEYALQVVGVEDDVREVILSASHPTDILNPFISEFRRPI